MTQQEKNIYRPVEELRRIVISLNGMKFKLDCFWAINGFKELIHIFYRLVQFLFS